MPPEVLAAVQRLRSRMSSPEEFLATLGPSLQKIVGRSGVRTSRALRGGPRALEARIDSLRYDFRREGQGLVVERQSIAGGFAVGMKDVLPLSRWPEQLAMDLANFADAHGQDWRQALAGL